VSNRLQGESSPYLRQHADNPVDWYPWGEEALRQARDRDRPIFLSIGYSACHWCHVMAHESFEDQAVAAFLNEHFVSIKVDREERPDLDQVYMAAVQAMTGGGGWPLSVFLTPDGYPFYGGTYFPPVPRYGLPSFLQVLQAVAEAWQHRRQELLSGGRRLVEALRQQDLAPADRGSGELEPATLHSAFHLLRQSFDPHHGGWDGAPKFPQPSVLEFLLRYHHLTGQAGALEMVTRTLEAMARGGIYDQVGGGFHRYAVDERWLVPHFEKMLYDNAQLARLYLHAWQVTGNDLFRAIAQETLDYVLRDMSDPAGGFYSTQDADSEGQEGKFFLWTEDQVRQVLGRDADQFLALYGVTRHGNFEGRNILTFVGPLEQRPALADARRRLLAARQQRVPPGRDEKVLTSWNGLMLAAFAEAARAWDRADYRLAAERNGRFLLSELRRGDGRLCHTWQGGQARLNGYLEDYVYLADGLLELYQTTFEPGWYRAAQELMDLTLAHFQAPDGTFFDTEDGHEALILRPRNLQDGATPSGNAVAVTSLLRLAGLSAQTRYVEIAHRALAAMQPTMARYPLGFGHWLQALSYALAPPREIAIVGAPDLADTQALLDVVRRGYRPFQVVALGAPGDQPPAVPLLEDRGLVVGRATAYVCRHFACQAPVVQPEELQAQLG